MKCPLCQREEVVLNTHHLVPVSKGGKKGRKIDICTNCHDQIHSVFTDHELRDNFNTLSKLKSSNRMKKFCKFIEKRPYKTYLNRKQSKKVRGK